MSDERRYDSGEVEEIFERAARAGGRESGAVVRSDGLTLTELQAIGSEVGLPAERIAEAARSLDRDDGYRRVLGLPLGVSRTFPLPRDPSDREWERLVADLRSTFHATGRVREEGRVRGWTHGNLHAFIEPDGEAGYRLRMGTTKGSARQFLAMSAALITMALILAVIGLLTGDEGLMFPAAMLSSMAVAGTAWTTLPLPRWAAERNGQMETIADRLAASLRGPAEEPRDRGRPELSGPAS